MASVSVMTSHDHHSAQDPWHDLPEGFADRLAVGARLSTPVRSAALERAALALDASPSAIVDLGSGIGADAVALAERFPSARVHALDVSAELLEHLAATASAAGVADRIDAHRIDLNEDWSAAIPDGVDLAWASLSLHHLDDPAAAIRRVFASLRAGGVFVLTELGADDKGAMQAVYGTHAATDWGRLLADTGFASIELSEHERVARADDDDDDDFSRSVWTAVRPGSESSTVREVDVAVLGGGPAGLAAAIALARSRRNVVVIDAGEPRNARADGAHNVFGNEGISPQQLLAKGRTEAGSYGVQIIRARATGVSGEIDDFTVHVADGARQIHARRIVIATGLVDDLPDVPGVAAGWGHSVLHCAFCHGWEVRDQRIAILSRGEIALHQALLFSQLSDRVTVFLHDAADPSEEQREQLAALNVEVVRPRVSRLVMDGVHVRGVEIDDGRIFDADAVVVVPRFNARAELYTMLGGVAEETSFGVQIRADPRGQSEVPGVWVAGNAREPMAMVVGAAAAGVMAGAAVNGDLAMADLGRR